MTPPSSPLLFQAAWGGGEEGGWCPLSLLPPNVVGLGGVWPRKETAFLFIGSDRLLSLPGHWCVGDGFSALPDTVQPSGGQPSARQHQSLDPSPALCPPSFPSPLPTYPKQVQLKC